MAAKKGKQMGRSGKNLLTVGVSTLILLLAIPAMGGSSKKRGTTFSNRTVEISSIESKKLKNDSIGNTWYAFKAKVRNRAKRNIKVSVCFQAIDRSGYEIDSICFYNKTIRKNGTGILTDKNVTERETYKAIWEWKIDTLKTK